MNSNTYTIYDSEGNYPDWVELYNPGTEEIDLSGMYLTDDLSEVDKWQIPGGVSIAGGSYLLIFLSGKDKKPIPSCTPPLVSPKQTKYLCSRINRAIK